MKQIGLFGAGKMGGAAIGKLVDSGYSLFVYDPDPVALRNAVDLGANAIQDLPNGVGSLHKVLLFLPGPVEIESCLLSDDGVLDNLPHGSTVVDFSTTSPESTLALARHAASKGIGYLDAPVLGRPDRVGSWTLPVGGRRAIYDECLPILEALGQTIIHVGESGTANKIKLLNQLMFGAINSMTAEMMAIAKKSGIAPRDLCRILTTSQAATVSGLFKELGERIESEDYEDPTFSMKLLTKDVHLALRLAQDSGIQPILGKAIHEMNQSGLQADLGELDTAALWKALIEEQKALVQSNSGK